MEIEINGLTALALLKTDLNLKNDPFPLTILIKIEP